MSHLTTWLSIGALALLAGALAIDLKHDSELKQQASEEVSNILAIVQAAPAQGDFELMVPGNISQTDIHILRETGVTTAELTVAQGRLCSYLAGAALSEKSTLGVDIQKNTTTTKIITAQDHPIDSRAVASACHLAGAQKKTVHVTLRLK
jgi:hypothetical protein